MGNILTIAGNLITWLWFPILVVTVILLDHKWDKVWKGIVWVWNRVPRIWWGVLLACLLFYMGQIFTTWHGTFVWGHKNEVFNVILHMDEVEHEQGEDGLNQYVKTTLLKK